MRRVAPALLPVGRCSSADFESWLAESTVPPIPEEAPAEDRAKAALVRTLMERDREVLELKRIHELSLRRVDAHHKRTHLKTEERAVYYEDNINKLTLESATNTSHEYKAVLKHRDMDSRARYLLMAVMVAFAAVCLRYLHVRYTTDPLRAYSPYFTRLHNTPRNFRKEWAAELREDPAFSGMTTGAR